jgi:hypothetical protein
MDSNHDSNHMESARDKFHDGRRAMRNAFVEVYLLAQQAGLDVTEEGHRFFDGNEAVQDAFRVVVTLAELRPAGSPAGRPAGRSADSRTPRRSGR